MPSKRPGPALSRAQLSSLSVENKQKSPQNEPASIALRSLLGIQLHYVTGSQ